MFPPSLLGLYCCPSQHWAGWGLFRLLSLPPLTPPPPKLVPGIPGFRQHPGSLSGTARLNPNLNVSTNSKTIFKTVLGFKQGDRRGSSTKKSCHTVLAIQVDTGGSHQRTSHEKFLPQEERQMSYSQTVTNSLVGRKADVVFTDCYQFFSKKKGICVFIDCCQMSQIIIIIIINRLFPQPHITLYKTCYTMDL